MAMTNDLDSHFAAEAERTDNYFRSVLAREDQARLARLRELLAASATVEQFAAEALYVGWTAGDLRSKELAPALEIFAKAMWRAEREGAPVDLVAAWAVFNAERMRVLIHCL
jgi:hypothetical protein